MTDTKQLAERAREALTADERVVVETLRRTLRRDDGEPVSEIGLAMLTIVDRLTASPAVPEGFVLVPKLATNDMLLAGCAAEDAYGCVLSLMEAVSVWNAMLASAPPPPVTEPEGEK